MAYNPVTDFLALLRQTSGGVRTERMPGLDYVVAALVRAGLFQVSVGQTAPTANQTTTAWLRPSLPSWVAEGTVFLWNALTTEYEPATPALWSALLGVGSGSGGGSAYKFQSAAAASNIIVAGTSLLAIQRAAPGATGLTLPTVAAQAGKPIQIVDWSTGVANHVVTIGPVGGATIMQAASFKLLSTAVQLGGVTLYPSPDLNGWVIAP